MEGVREFLHQGVLYAIACARPRPDTVRFVTPLTAPLQVGVLDRPAGYVVEAHSHPGQALAGQGLSEFVYVESGRILVTLFDDDWRELGVCELAAGDHIVMFRGGHAVKVLEPVRLIEVKQGSMDAAMPTKRFRGAAAMTPALP